MDTAFFSTDTFKKHKQKTNLRETELHVLNSLLQNNDIIIHKANKGNTIVDIVKDEYKNEMKAIIWYRSKFEKPDIQGEKHLNFILNIEKRLK